MLVRVSPALFVVGSILRVHAIQANTPGPDTLIECQPSQLSWSDSEGPVQILVYPGGVSSGTPLETLPTVSSGSAVTWLVDLPAGVEYTLEMRDLTTGSASFTAPVPVSPNPVGDTSCEGKNGSGQQSGLPSASAPASSTPPAGTSGSTTQPPASGASAGSTVTTPSTTTPGNGGFPSGPDTSQSSAASTETTTTHKRSSPIGAIVGAVCAVVVIAVIVGVVLYLRRRKRVRGLPHATDVHPEAMAEPTYRSSAPAMSTPSEQTAVSTQLPPPRRELEPVRPSTIVTSTSSGKRQPVVMSAQPEENAASAPTPQQLAALDEENAMLRAVIARMQASHTPPTDSGTLAPPPSYDSRSTYSA